MDQRIIDRLNYCLERNKPIAFLVGAGISEASGIPTFRGKDGFWVSGSKNYKPQEIGTFRMFNINAEEVWKWFIYRKSITAFAEPNPSHYHLVTIEELLGDQFALISQNVDGLHRDAGNSEKRTHLIHGDHDYVRCGDDCTSELFPFPTGIDLKNRDHNVITSAEWELLKCPNCGELLRPHVLWFDELYNEKYYKLYTVLRISKEADMLFIVGTSGATNLPQQVADNVLFNSGMVVDVNIEDNYFTEMIDGKKNGVKIRMESTEFLGELVAEIQRIKG